MQSNMSTLQNRTKGTNSRFGETQKQKKETVSVIIITQLLLQLTTGKDKLSHVNSHNNSR